jgi:hypothetical protein
MAYVGFWPISKIVQSDQEVLISLVTLWEGTCYVSGYPSKWDPEVILMHLALIPDLGTMTGCTGVALLAPLLNIIFSLESVVPLLGLIQGLVDTQVTT